MLHLLLTSTLIVIQKMTLFNSKQDLLSIKFDKGLKINSSSKEDAVLCNHCKRTASNGVRCLGMCVADNDY